MDPDDDPLTSPSFPKIPASDSRSYHNGRADTPAGGSRVPGRHLAPTQQFASYGPPAPQRASARHASGQHALPADVGGDTDRTNPNGYLPDPLLDGNPYPTSAASAPTAPVPPAPRPAASASAAPASAAPIASASGNPYGSYVTPGSHAAASYDEYPGMPGNGHGSYLPAAVPEDTGTRREWLLAADGATGLLPRRERLRLPGRPGSGPRYARRRRADRRIPEWLRTA